MKLTNQTMANYLRALQGISEKVTGRFAYAVARNMRKLQEELTEYTTIRENTIRKYGDVTEEGTSQIKLGTPAFDKFIEEMSQYNDIEHDVQLMQVSERDLLSSPLNANEILSVDFMVKEDTNE